MAAASTKSARTSLTDIEMENQVRNTEVNSERGNTAGAQSTSPLFNAEPEARAQPSDEAEDQYITGIKLYLVLFGVTLVMFLVMLDQTIVVTAIPSISNEFNSIKDIGWYGTGYLLCTAALQPLMGKFYQYYTSKTNFLTGLFVFEVGSLIAALAKSSTMLIMGRVVSGLGGSGLIIGLLTILAAAAPLEKRPLYLGCMMGIGSLGIVLGPVLGGILSQHASWRWCFWINLPIGGLTAILLSLISIPDAKFLTTKATFYEQLKRLDLPGFLIFAPTCTMLLLAVEWGGVLYSWKSATIIGLFLGSLGMLTILLFWEHSRGDTAMIPLHLLRNRVVVCAAITVILSQGALMVVTYYLPLWFQVVLGVSPTMGGVYYLPSVGAQIVGSVLSGALTSRLGYADPFVIAGTASSAIACGLLSTLTVSSGAGMWVTYQIIAGFSRGLVAQQPLTAIQAILPKSQLAVGNSFLMFCQILGGALFVSFGQTTFSNQLRPALARWAPDVDPEVVFAVGATAFRGVLQEGQVKGVVRAYDEALTKTFYLGAGAAAVAFFASFGLGWTNLKKVKREPVKGDLEDVKMEDVVVKN